MKKVRFKLINVLLLLFISIASAQNFTNEFGKVIVNDFNSVQLSK